jgi:outer membrane protein insertion porin family
LTYQTNLAGLIKDENGNVKVSAGGFAEGYDGSLGYLSVPVINANGQPVLDANGNQQLQLAAQPYDIYGDRNSFGGNILTTASIELLFPLPMVEDRGRVRSSLFFDVGSVFSNNCSVRQTALNTCGQFDTGDLRYSVGVGVTYLSPFGPLTFYLAKPFTKNPNDQTKSFDFTIGAGF